MVRETGAQTVVMTRNFLDASSEMAAETLSNLSELELSPARTATSRSEAFLKLANGHAMF